MSRFRNLFGLAAMATARKTVLLLFHLISGSAVVFRSARRSLRHQGYIHCCTGDIRRQVDGTNYNLQCQELCRRVVCILIEYLQAGRLSAAILNNYQRNQLLCYLISSLAAVNSPGTAHPDRRCCCYSRYYHHHRRRYYCCC